MSEGTTEVMQKNERKFVKWLKGDDRVSRWENVSYAIMFAAAGLIFIGLLLGSFVKYVVYAGAFGAFLLLAGIGVYIASQLIENKTGSVSAGPDHSVKA
ncbi:MAG: hypothetical protein QXU82_00655 [Candidatus Aenigmatarchaeota archaeon]